MSAIRATLWDFGGVISESPFDAFSRYEQAQDLPTGFLRKLNATDPDTNAWARLERNEVSMAEFCALFEAEARAAGRSIDARSVMGLLAGAIRPEMVEAVRRCAAHLPTGLITNNFTGFDDAVPADEVLDGRAEMREVLSLFHVVIESSKVGLRKPDARIYEVACEALGAALPTPCRGAAARPPPPPPPATVFLDDLGVNLKPARAMGMTTIKVEDPSVALAALEAAVGFPVRAMGGGA